MVPRGPELEGQERIQLLPMVATPCRVLGEEALDRVRPEQARAADHVGRAEVPEEGRQVGAEPACQRDAEALLWARQNLARQHPRERALEHVLGREAPELQTDRQARRELDRSEEHTSELQSPD